MRAPPEHRKSMFSLIEGWQQSGVSQKAFCEQHRIAPHVFYYWYKCYRAQNDVAVVQPSKRFIELSFSAESPRIALWVEGTLRLVGRDFIFN